MERLDMRERSPVVGKTLEESELRKTYGLIVVVIKKKLGQMAFNPVASYVIESRDKLIALGEENNLVALSRMCQG
ncbi:MAG: hypothetical protein JXI32_08575 [Deltaproteobacteria bacterium]|nr:hypothetical protein [Deltaproteobacteria bacterium]